jgi:UDP-glucose/GDP-mannose dehydrogenase family, NAD binding domain
MTSFEGLREEITTHTVRCGVTDPGYVGLPPVIELARAGFLAIGPDVDAGKVDATRSGGSYIVDAREAEIAELVAANRLTASTDFGAVVVKRLPGDEVYVGLPARARRVASSENEPTGRPAGEDAPACAVATAPAGSEVAAVLRHFAAYVRGANIWRTAGSRFSDAHA